MTYPITRMVRVLEAAGCTNAAAGAIALIRDQERVKGIAEGLRDLPEPGTPMTAEERQRWTDRFGLLVDVYLPVSESDRLS